MNRGRDAYALSVDATSFDVTRPVGADAVLLRDVGPRDGLQAISQEVSLETKITMTNGLVAAGVHADRGRIVRQPEGRPADGRLTPGVRCTAENRSRPARHSS